MNIDSTKETIGLAPLRRGFSFAQVVIRFNMRAFVASVLRSGIALAEHPKA